MNTVLIGWNLRVDPLLQRVPQLLSLDWLSQGAQGRLELSDGGGQIPEPAAGARLLLQHPALLSWGQRGGLMLQHFLYLGFKTHL